MRNKDRSKFIYFKYVRGTLMISFTLGVLFIIGCNRRITSQNGITVQNKKWKQQEFVLSTFHAVRNSTNPDIKIYRKVLSQTQASGINLVELTFLNSHALTTALQVCEEFGIKSLAEDISKFSGVGSQAPSFDEQMIQQNVKQLSTYKKIEGYYIWDEPTKENFGKLRSLRDLFKKYDSSRLAFSVIFPSYGLYNWSDSSYPAYVDNYLSTIDPEVVSFDYYPFRDNSESTTLLTNDLWKDFGYIRKKALEYNKPLWFYFQASGMQPQEKSIMNLERIRAQMYAGLAYGVKGLSYFTSAGVLLDSNSNKTPMYDDLTELNAEVKNIGNFLFTKQSEKIYQTGITTETNELYFLDKMSESGLLKSAPENLVIGLFGDNGSKKYLLITNKSHNKIISGAIQLRKAMRISRFDKKKNKTDFLTDSSDMLNINLPAGEAILYILQ